MAAAWENKFHTLPKLEDNLQINFTELTFSGMHFGDDPSQKSTLKSTLKGTKKNIVELIAANPNVTIQQAAELLSKNIRGIAKHFKNLQDQGIIRRVGGDKGGHWEIIEK